MNKVLKLLIVTFIIVFTVILLPSTKVAAYSEYDRIIEEVEEHIENGSVINKILTNGKTISVSDEYDTIGRLRKNVISVKNKTLNIDYEYDKTRITKQSFWNDDEISYEYDVVGNVENITYNDNESSVNYKYNKLGMLEEETLTDGTVTSYTYDENGNIKTKRSILNEVVILDEEYTYHDIIKDRLMYVTNKLTNSISKQLVYDSNNEFYPSSINGENLVWEGNLLKSYKGHTFEYDSNGTRTKIIKRNSSGELVKTTSFVLEGTNIISMTINELSGEYKLDFTYDANSKLIGLSTIQGNYFYVRDITGNIIGLIDSNGNYVIQYKYDAWGNLLSNLPSIDDDAVTIAAKYNPFIYKGYFYDSGTRLYYCNYRYYFPELCRWISPDSIDYLNPKTINGMNLYCYCFNNPINYIDSSGHIAFWLACGIVVGIIGTLAGGFYAYNKSKKQGNTGWTVVGDVVLGAHIGGAVGFAVGALFGAGTSILLTGSASSICGAVLNGAKGLAWAYSLGGPGAAIGYCTNNVYRWMYGTHMIGYFPDGEGFNGTPQKITLQPGTIIQRFGPPTSEFAAPYYTDPFSLSLPYYQLPNMYSPNLYVINQPIDVLAGQAAPWFGQYGGGTQYMFSEILKVLLDSEVISKL